MKILMLFCPNKQHSFEPNTQKVQKNATYQDKNTICLKKKPNMFCSLIKGTILKMFPDCVFVLLNSILLNFLCVWMLFQNASSHSFFKIFVLNLLCVWIVYIIIYVCASFVQFGTWAVWLCQLSLFILSVIKLCRYHSQENFLISMSRERQRLIQRVQSQSSYSAPVPTQRNTFQTYCFSFAVLDFG